MGLLFVVASRILALLLVPIAVIGLAVGFIVAGARPLVSGLQSAVRHHAPNPAAHA